tara:strand:+ start:3259 stop:3966 length:708 start_codon:yes stop_codon:yes gene_type:complete
MTQRINIYLDDELALELKKNKPKFLSLSGYCSFVLAQALDKDAKISAYHVGAGEKKLSNEAEVQTSIQSLKSTSNISSISASEKEKISPPLNRLGDGVGRESEGTPRKIQQEINSIAKRKKIAPEKLKPYWDKIEAFWRVKKGTKNLQAYALQITELEKILEDLGKDVLIEQLDLACMAGTWKQINYRRTVQYMEKEKKSKPEPEMKHPAYKVHTAKDLGYDNGPTKNPILKDIF